MISDARGEFVIHREKPFDRVQLQFGREGIAPYKAWLPASNGVQVVHLGSGGFITGRIMKDGRPIPNVELGVRDEEPYRSMVYSSHVETITDADGYFTFRSLPPQSNWYLYSMPDSLKDRGAIPPRLIRLGDHGETNELGEVSVRPGFTLSGRLVPAAGQKLPQDPLKLFVVFLGKSWQQIELETQPDGSFSLAGCYDDIIEVTLRTPGWRFTPRNRSVDPDYGRRLVGTLPESKTNFWIEVEPGQPASGGGFINLPKGDAPASRPLAGIEPGAVMIEVKGMVVDDRTGDLIRHFRLIPGRQPPIPAKPVKPFLQRILDSLKDQKLPIDEWPSWFRSLEQTFTNGGFDLEFEVLTSQPLLQISADGYAPVAVGPITSSTNGLVVRLARGISPKGVVLTPDNQPAAGATVNDASFPEYVVLRAQGKLIDEQATVESIETDAAGAFAFPDKLDGKHLYVSHPSGWALVDESEFDEKMKIRLEPWATVTGTLVDTNGSPVSGSELSLKMNGFDGMDSGPQLVMEFKTKTDDRGAFAFSFVPPGDLMLFRNIPPPANSNRAWTLSLQTRFYAAPGETNNLGHVILDSPPPKPLLERLKKKVGL
ncbi:hypothetical protein GC207_08155 [bacterium]|nr:hypothetical protein [bacterium]